MGSILIIQKQSKGQEQVEKNDQKNQKPIKKCLPVNKGSNLF